MAKIIIDSNALLRVAGLIEADCCNLFYTNEESLSDVEQYAIAIQNAVDELRQIVTKAEKAKGE